MDKNEHEIFNVSARQLEYLKNHRFIDEDGLTIELLDGTKKHYKLIPENPTDKLKGVLDTSKDHSRDSDMVNHPNHYQSARFEVIDIVDEFTKDYSGEMAFDIGNVIKYVLRAVKKNGVEDLKKARWYLDRVIDKLEKGDDRG